VQAQLDRGRTRAMQVHKGPELIGRCLDELEKDGSTFKRRESVSPTLYCLDSESIDY
jgi:hypothetical protein